MDIYKEVVSNILYVYYVSIRQIIGFKGYFRRADSEIYGPW